MRLSHALVLTALLGLACAGGATDDVEGVDDAVEDIAGDADEDQAEDEDEDEAEAPDDTDDEPPDEDVPEEEEVEDEPAQDEEAPVKTITKQCSAQAFRQARNIGALKGGTLSNAKCAGNWGGADVTGVGRALLSFDNGWEVVAVGPNGCRGPTTRVCQVIGFK